MDSLMLSRSQTVPLDRTWAVLHDASDYGPAIPVWASCRNFKRGNAIPALAALAAQSDGVSITLTYPDLGSLSSSPNDPGDVACFIEWIMSICASNRARHRTIVRVARRGIKDTDYLSVSMMKRASHAAVTTVLNRSLQEESWRARILLDGFATWVETGWPMQQLRIGNAALAIRGEPMIRCLHAATNMCTEDRDADMLGALEALTRTQAFGSYAKVTTAGTIRIDEIAKVLR